MKRKSRKKLKPGPPTLEKIREVLLLQETEKTLLDCLGEVMSRSDRLLRDCWVNGLAPNFIVADSKVYEVGFKSQGNRFYIKPASEKNVMYCDGVMCCDGAVPDQEVTP